MRSRRLLAVVLAALAFVVSGCGDTYQVALRVGDDSLSHADAAELIELWAVGGADITEAVVGPELGTPQARSVEVTTLALSIEIQKRLAEVIAEEEGLDTDFDQADIDAIDALLQAQVLPPEVYQAFLASSPEFQDYFREYFLYLDLTQTVLEQPDVEIYVSPRYGSYDDQIGVVPPTGPVTPGGGFGLDL